MKTQKYIEEFDVRFETEMLVGSRGGGGTVVSLDDGVCDLVPKLKQRKDGQVECIRLNSFFMAGAQ